MWKVWMGFFKWWAFPRYTILFFRNYFEKSILPFGRWPIGRSLPCFFIWSCRWSLSKKFLGNRYEILAWNEKECLVIQLFTCLHLYWFYRWCYWFLFLQPFGQLILSIFQSIGPICFLIFLVGSVCTCCNFLDWNFSFVVLWSTAWKTNSVSILYW